MKKSSHRARRLKRNQNRKAPTLNLVSLMDIFTILVFFLLVNSSDSQQPQSDSIKLPEAHVDKPIGQSLVVQVDGHSIIVQGRVITDLDTEPVASQIGSLITELKYQAERSSETDPQARALTLMADREIPFSLLKRIMLSASEAGFGQISLAVIGKAEEKPTS